MAAFLPEHADFLNELLHDSDSEGEFEGFELDDIEPDVETNNVNNDDDTFLMENWVVGDRDPIDLQFAGTPGLNAGLNVDDELTVADLFSLFFPDNLFEIMATETNRYAADYLEKNAANIKQFSRYRKWKDTTPEEMKIYLGIIFAMGMIKQLDTSEYWTTDEVNETPFFRKCMSRDRFWLLMTFFHLVDNTNHVARGQPGYDPLFKLGTVYKVMVSKFASTYSPNRQLSLDEGMIPWRGNLGFKVYNPDKPHKYGIKAYMICDATNGYICKFKLYTGKSDIPPSENGATYDLVFDMMRNYFGKGHILYMDNYYSSPQLYWDLYIMGVGASGTLRANRKGVPQIVKDKALKEKGQKFVVHNKDLMLLKFSDRKIVHLLSTVDSASDVPSGKNNPRTGDPVLRPQVVVNYDKYMGGVDRADQMVSYATYNARTLKWWKRVIFHVMSAAVLNAFIIYKTTTTDRPPMLQRQFRKKLVHELVAAVDRDNLPVSRNVGKPQHSEVLFRLQGRHFPEKIPPTGTKRVSRSCVVCVPAERKALQKVGEKRKRPGRESSYQCQQCKKTLCVDPCFRLYHTYKDYERAYSENGTE